MSTLKWLSKLFTPKIGVLLLKQAQKELSPEEHKKLRLRRKAQRNARKTQRNHKK